VIQFEFKLGRRRMWKENMFNRQFMHPNKSYEGKEFVIERVSKIRLEKGWMFIVLKIY
jgi:hypothetical protein